MGDARSRRVEVTVLGDRFSIRTQGSAADERQVQSAADLLAERIEEIGRNTKELSSLRLALMAGLDLATELLAKREAHERDLADEASFRSGVRARSDRLLGMVRAEIEERGGCASSDTGTGTGSET